MSVCPVRNQSSSLHLSLYSQEIDANMNAELAILYCKLNMSSEEQPFVVQILKIEYGTSKLNALDRSTIYVKWGNQ